MDKKRLVTLLAGGAKKLTNYYIDQTNGADANSGLTTALPWKTISKVNASAPTACKLNFLRGETWREILTNTSSRAAYGNGLQYVL